MGRLDLRQVAWFTTDLAMLRHHTALNPASSGTMALMPRAPTSRAAPDSLGDDAFMTVAVLRSPLNYKACVRSTMFADFSSHSGAAPFEISSDMLIEKSTRRAAPASR